MLKMHSNSLRKINRLSQIFQPINVLPKNANLKKNEVTSRSQRLLVDLGFIRPSSPGCFHYLPMGLRALDKLTKIIDSEMEKVGAQKISLSELSRTDLWNTTGRLESMGKELFMLRDRHDKSYVLNPTCEESVCDLISSVAPMSHQNFPLRLYQIGQKYRDEVKPRFGLMRGRQFIMKDLYTFDVDATSAQRTYEEISESYSAILDRLKVPYCRVLGATGSIGGSMSHEYHYPAEVGEDELLQCEGCGYAANTELCGRDACPRCGRNVQVALSRAIEVGHTFLLGERYSQPLGCRFLGGRAARLPLQMGCYGLGVSRLLAAAVEVLSGEHEVRWPLALAPFRTVLVPPKAGSTQEAAVGDRPLALYAQLDAQPALAGQVLLDDRTHLTVGRRLLDARRAGHPFAVVAGAAAAADPPRYELHEQRRTGGAAPLLGAAELLHRLGAAFAAHASH